MVRRWSWVGIGLVGTLSAAFGADAPGQSAPPAELAAPRVVGTASCAASNCHGGNGKVGAKGSEYTSWVLHDPHANAYEVLANKKSQTIARNLNLPGHNAQQAQQCLACHATQPVQPGLVGDGFDVAFGVGCESCHGPAEHWLGPHTTHEWASKSWNTPADAAYKTDLGMTNTKHLSVRIKACAECHVGREGREVDHDLIAAGHPRLNFEFGAFHAQLPKHWRQRKTKSEIAAGEPGDKDRHPDFEARAWGLGQLVSAQTALELLAARSNPKSDKPWPEFTEFDCFACHHDLRSDSQDDKLVVNWRQRRWVGDQPGLVPGGMQKTGRRATLPWGSWLFPLTAEAESPKPGTQLATALAELEKVQGEMLLAKSMTLGARQSVHDLATAAAQRMHLAIAQWEQQPAFTPNQLRTWQQQIAARPADHAVWDTAAQTTLALMALEHARRDLDRQSAEPAVTTSLQDLLKTLEFPRTAPDVFDSPRKYDPAKYAASLQTVQDALK